MPNVIVTIREYTVKQPLTLNMVVESATLFRRIIRDDNAVRTVNLKENDVLFRINKSFYLRQKDYKYVLLDVQEEFICNNPKIFELKELPAEEKGKKE